MNKAEVNEFEEIIVKVPAQNGFKELKVKLPKIVLTSQLVRNSGV